MKKEMEVYLSRDKKYFLVISLWILMLACAESTSSRLSLQVQNQLKRLNKSPLKSIKSQDGDIIDCVNFYDQPAFDHPLLKNHIIQKRPPLQLKTTFDTKKVYPKPITQLWHLNGKCPPETIPIRRTRKHDILRAESVQSFGRKKYVTLPQLNTTKTIHGQNLKEYVIAYRESGRKYYGSKASISIWNPRVQQPNEFSASQLWISAVYTDVLEVGWHVYNQLYGDNNTRLFIYWTSDRYESTGCYNLFCSGFFQCNRNIVLGGTLAPVSILNGDPNDLNVYIFKERVVGNWWLQYGDQIVGFWPSSLFSHLNDSATSLKWGGEIVNRNEGGQHTTTEMGSGRFPSEGFGSASYFKQIKYLNESMNLRDVRSLHPFVSKPTCYDIQIDYGGEMGTHFFYGGPGRNGDCP